MARLMIHLLGPFLANLGGMPITQFESDKVRAILAYLMVESAGDHRREKLAGLLWAEMPEKRARSNLSQALYNLSRALDEPQTHPPFLLRSRESVQFNPNSDYWLDVAAFTYLLEDVAHHRHAPAELCASCFLKLQQAVALYRGDFLEGLECGLDLALGEWCLTRRARFNRQALEALHLLTAYCEHQGEIGKALDYAWMQVDLDPYHETAQRQLMRLLAANQQRNQALAQYKRLELLLSDELGVAPEPDTTELYERISGEHAAWSSSETVAHNLPAPLTPFIGRRAELQELDTCLQHVDCRLLTILGPGGSGKTRLAVELARSQLSLYKHGVYFVSLSALQSSEAILPAVVGVINCPLQEMGDPRQQLNNYLKDKQLLLVLDGCEHLLEGAALLADILHAAPQVKILLTSRARLNLKGEHAYPLGGLHYPPKYAPASDILGAEAVQLFLKGAKRVRPDFEPQPGELSAILQVCRQVQGMPLGILLASAWVASMEVEQIPAEIERSLDFLSADWVDAPARQRSLRATYDHSWNLLTPDERAILKSLSVFRGGFIQNAAQAVAGASTHELRTLVNKSMLLRKSNGRYDMHELLRQYSAEMQAEAAEEDLSVHERHGLYYAKLLLAWEPRLKSPQQEAVLAEMDVELENIRSAWNWTARQGIIPLLYHMVESFCLYHSRRVRYQEGESACRLALDRLAAFVPEAEETRTRTLIKIWQSHFNRLLGRNDPAQHLRLECRTLLEQTAAQALDTRAEHALLSFELGESIKESSFAVAREHFLRSLSLFQELGQQWWAAQAMLELAICHTQIGDIPGARTWFEQCAVSLPEHGDQRSLAKALRWKGFLHVRQGELDQAVSSMQEAASAYRSIGDRINIADSMSGLGLILLWAGRCAESLELVNQSLQIYLELGNRYQTVFMHLIRAIVLAFLGMYLAAEDSARTSLSQAREFDFRRVIAASLTVQGWLALVKCDPVGAGELLQESVDEYRQVQHQDELGWALAALGQARLAQENRHTGLACLREALQIGLEVKAAMSIYQALGPGAVWLGRQGRPERALEIYSLARSNPGVAHSRWFEEIYGRQVAELVDGLPAEAAAAAQERGRELDLWETARALIQELS